MNFRSALLRSAAAAALFAAAAPTAQAGFVDGLPEYYFSVEGGLAVTDPSTIFPSGGSGGDGLDEIFGGRAAIRFGTPIDSKWDWRIGLAWSQFPEAEASVGAPTPGVELSESFEWQYATADFDIGYRPEMPELSDLRVFAGLRALYSKESADKVGDFSSSIPGPFPGPVTSDFSFDFGAENRFVGVGPRIGAEFETRLNGNWGISGMGSVAALFGSLETSGGVRIEACPPVLEAVCESGSLDQSFSESATVINFDVAIGLDYHMSETSKWTFGVWAQRFDDIHSGFFSSPEPDAYAWGPFINFSLRM